ncbi:MAG: Ig-like domain-containing protein [Myxococcales bacterium]|nr:Ig-like domain-containing protein [Myxococcales bacterium]
MLTRIVTLLFVALVIGVVAGPASVAHACVLICEHWGRATVPQDGATGVPLDQAIVVIVEGDCEEYGGSAPSHTYSVVDSVPYFPRFSVVDSAGNSVLGEVDAFAEGFRFLPQANWEAGEEYTVEFALSEAEDGTSSDDFAYFSFTTGDAVSPADADFGGVTSVALVDWPVAGHSCCPEEYIGQCAYELCFESYWQFEKMVEVRFATGESSPGPSLYAYDVFRVFEEAERLLTSYVPEQDGAQVVRLPIADNGRVCVRVSRRRTDGQPMPEGQGQTQCVEAEDVEHVDPPYEISPRSCQSTSGTDDLANGADMGAGADVASSDAGGANETPDQTSGQTFGASGSEGGCQTGRGDVGNWILVLLALALATFKSHRRRIRFYGAL